MCSAWLPLPYQEKRTRKATVLNIQKNLPPDVKAGNSQETVDVANAQELPDQDKSTWDPILAADAIACLPQKPILVDDELPSKEDIAESPPPKRMRAVRRSAHSKDMCLLL